MEVNGSHKSTREMYDFRSPSFTCAIIVTVEYTISLWSDLLHFGLGFTCLNNASWFFFPLDSFIPFCNFALLLWAHGQTAFFLFAFHFHPQPNLLPSCTLNAKHPLYTHLLFSLPLLKLLIKKTIFHKGFLKQWILCIYSLFSNVSQKRFMAYMISWKKLFLYIRQIISHYLFTLFSLT